MTLTNEGARALKVWRGDRSYYDISYDLRITANALRNYEGGSAPNRANALRLLEVAGIPVAAWDAPAQPETEPKPTGGD